MVMSIKFEFDENIISSLVMSFNSFSLKHTYTHSNTNRLINCTLQWKTKQKCMVITNLVEDISRYSRTLDMIRVFRLSLLTFTNRLYITSGSFGAVFLNITKDVFKIIILLHVLLFRKSSPAFIWKRVPLIIANPLQLWTRK